MDKQNDRRKWIFRAVLTIAISLIRLAPVGAETQIRGSQDDLQVSIQNGSIKEVLDALSGNFNLSYRIPSISNLNISGVYTGTLYRVLTRILDGNDYVVETSDNGIKIIIIGVSGTTANSPPNQTALVTENTIASPTLAKPAADSMPTPKSSSPPPLSTYLSANGAAAATQGSTNP